MAVEQARLRFDVLEVLGVRVTTMQHAFVAGAAAGATLCALAVIVGAGVARAATA